MNTSLTNARKAWPVIRLAVAENSQRERLEFSAHGSALSGSFCSPQPLSVILQRLSEAQGELDGYMKELSRVHSDASPVQWAARFDAISNELSDLLYIHGAHLSEAIIGDNGRRILAELADQRAILAIITFEHNEELRRFPWELLYILFDLPTESARGGRRRGKFLGQLFNVVRLCAPRDCLAAHSGDPIGTIAIASSPEAQQWAIQLGLDASAANDLCVVADHASLEGLARTTDMYGIAARSTNSNWAPTSMAAPNAKGDHIILSEKASIHAKYLHGSNIGQRQVLILASCKSCQIDFLPDIVARDLNIVVAFGVFLPADIAVYLLTQLVLVVKDSIVGGHCVLADAFASWRDSIGPFGSAMMIYAPSWSALHRPVSHKISVPRAPSSR